MYKYLLSLLTVFFLSAATQAQTDFPKPQLTTVEGEPVELAERIGKGVPTVIAVWATWCQPCHMELDHMKKYLDKWEGEYGVNVLAVSIDQPNMVKRIAPLVSRKGWAYEILVDRNGELQQKLGFRSIPQMYIVDGQGKIVKEFSGYASGREDLVDAYLADLVIKK